MLYRSGGQPEGQIYKSGQVYFKSFHDCKVQTSARNRTVTAIISTASVDTDGDAIMPSGLDVSDYHGQLLWNHDGNAYPLGKVLKVERRPNDVVAIAHFTQRPPEHPPTVEWAPDTVFHLLKEDALRCFSVGFTVPLGGWRMAHKNDKSRFGDDVRRVISSWKIRELSVVNIPANPGAVSVAISKGLIPRDSCVVGNLLAMDAGLAIPEFLPLDLDMPGPAPLDL